MNRPPVWFMGEMGTEQGDVGHKCHDMLLSFVDDY